MNVKEIIRNLNKTASSFGLVWVMLLAGLCCSSAPGYGNSFIQLYELARKNDPTLKIASQNKGVALAQAKIENASLYPVIQLSAQAIDSKSRNIDSSQTLFDTDSFSNNSEGRVDTEHVNWEFSIDQKLFDLPALHIS